MFMDWEFKRLARRSLKKFEEVMGGTMKTDEQDG